ncbi:hypothetical protein [Cupriavidus cauae]|nr:hypothetical protein [Cupriavidus cauae]KAA0180346.1 hypothetical protein FX016_14315 [Cupriavidus gilardii]
MSTAHDPYATGDDAMPIDPHRSRPFRRRDESMSREDLVHLVRKQAAATVAPWGVFAAVGTGIGLILSVMGYMNSTTQDKVDKGTGPLSVQIVELDKRLSGRLDALEGRLGALEGRLGALEVRVGAVETRLERMDAKLDRLLGK